MEVKLFGYLCKAVFLERNLIKLKNCLLSKKLKTEKKNHFISQKIYIFLLLLGTNKKNLKGMSREKKKNYVTKTLCEKDLRRKFCKLMLSLASNIIKLVKKHSC